MSAFGNETVRNALRPTVNGNVDTIFTRTCSTLPYLVPETLLREVAPLAHQLLVAPESLADLSKSEKKGIIEKYQAGFLAFMVKRSVDCVADVSVAVVESADYDCVLRGKSEGKVAYVPVQLKQLPSEDVNSRVTLQALLESVRKKYPRSTDLIVSIWMNRDLQIRLSDIDVTGLNIQQLWLIGDHPNGDVTAHGGLLNDWRERVVWFGVLKDGEASVRTLRF